MVHDEHSFSRDNLLEMDRILIENKIIIINRRSINQFDQDVEATNDIKKRLEIIEAKKADIEIPDEFCDTIMGVFIEHPVVIPETGNKVIMDLGVIKTCLMNAQENPFTRSELTLEILEEYNRQPDIVTIIEDFERRRRAWIKETNYDVGM